MHRKRLTTALVVLAASAVGLSLVIGTASGQVRTKSATHSTKAAAAATTIKVTIGKPSEFAFTLSKTSSIPVGKVIFVVTNAGKIGHDFKVCSKTVTAAKANACLLGSKTKTLQKGQSATLTVTLAKGKFEFLCTVSGHAALGMKGLVGVGVALSAKDTTPVKTSTTTPAGGGGGGGGGGACTAPKTTSVTIGMTEFAFAMSTSTIPCGSITFVANNQGMEDHNFSVGGNAPGPIAAPGGSVSQTLTLAPGTYSTRCDVGNHAGAGMVGSFTVTA